MYKTLAKYIKSKICVCWLQPYFGLATATVRWVTKYCFYRIMFLNNHCSNSAHRKDDTARAQDSYPCLEARR